MATRPPRRYPNAKIGQTYTPKPVDTSSVVLPHFLLKLRERLARNVHENWAQARIAQGWRYGQTRDDDAKTHPCLVPYSRLSNSEKKYDRITAIETLKTIIALGYKIREKADGA